MLRCRRRRRVIGIGIVIVMRRADADGAVAVCSEVGETVEGWEEAAAQSAADVVGVDLVFGALAEGGEEGWYVCWRCW